MQDFDVKSFLARDWQRQPKLFRGIWPNFEDPIQPELLAGLAMEEGVDARVIQHLRSKDAKDAWHVEHGPFTDYEGYGETDWTLLVQSVNEWWPQVQALLQPFRFLPDWRVDDVMVSFAVPGGSVGPHLDQYDVFIIQGEGERHWQVGARKPLQQHRPHPDLQQLAESFEPVIDVVLQAGDMLYIPAGCPHHGEALTPSLNYSIGFRAPTQVDLQASVTDMLLDQDVSGPRYQDPMLTDSDEPSYGDSWRVDAKQRESLKAFLQQSLDSNDFDTALLRVLSQSKRPLPQPELELTAAQIQVMETQDVWLCRTPGARLLVTETNNAFVNGEQLEGAAQNPALVASLAQSYDDIPADSLDLAQADNAELVAQLINQGAWYFSVEDLSAEDDADEE